MMTNKTKYLIIIFLLIVYLLLLIYPSIIFNNKESADNKIVDIDIYNELAQCANSYISSILAKDYKQTNNINTLFNKKDISKLDILNNELSYLNLEKLIIKEIYELDKNVYKCYFLKEVGNNVYSNMFENISKDNMNSITIRLYEDRFVVLQMES